MYKVLTSVILGPNRSVVSLQTLERNWKTIRDEALAVMDQNTGLFTPEEENLREKGEWGQYTLWQQGTNANVPKSFGSR